MKRRNYHNRYWQSNFR